MIAQSLVEYGALSSFIESARHLESAALDMLGDVSPATWAVIGVVVLFVVLARHRRRASRL